METLNPKKIKVDKEQQFEEMRKATCAYPVMDDEGQLKPCGEKQFMMMSMPIVNIGESGKPIISESLSVMLPFCNYHDYLMMSGMFGALTDDKGNVTGIHGPLEAVQIVEAVLNAYMMADKFKEIAKAMREGELLAEKSINKETKK